jgi:hypothetical protein
LTPSGRTECAFARDKLAAVNVDEPRSACVDDPITRDARPDGEQHIGFAG